MLEIVVALVLAILVSVGVRIYARRFLHGGPQDADFERWCRTKPVVVALRLADGAQRDVIESLRHLLAPDEFWNRAGRFPWQHYLVRFEWRRLGSRDVTIVVDAFARERARQQRPDIGEVLAALGREHASRIEEVWLHGHLHAAELPRERLGWTGRFEPDGTLAVEPMIGRPAWLEPDAQAA